MTITASRSDLARRGLRFEEWPEFDRNAWLAATAEGDVLEDRGRGARWAEATRKTNRYHYGRWLGYRTYIGQLDQDQAPADRVTPETVENYIRHLVALGTTAPYTRLAMVVGLKEVIRAMAPDRNWRWLQDLCNRLNRQAEPSIDKGKRVVSTFEIYEAALNGLSGLSEKSLDQDACIDYRDHLMLALMAKRPLRVKNVTNLKLGRHVIQVEGRWLITIPAVETKGKSAVEYWMPEDLVPFFERYLAEVRPHFPGTDRTAQLWLHETGPRLPSIFVYRRIVPLTERLLGAPINPHLLRDCAATALSLESADHVQIAPALLGHRNPATTTRYYVQARNLEASRIVNGILADLKAELENET